MKTAKERTKKMTKAQLVEVIEHHEAQLTAQAEALVSSREKYAKVVALLAEWYDAWRETDLGKRVEATREHCPKVAAFTMSFTGKFDDADEWPWKHDGEPPETRVGFSWVTTGEKSK